VAPEIVGEDAVDEEAPAMAGTTNVLPAKDITTNRDARLARGEDVMNPSGQMLAEQNLDRLSAVSGGMNLHCSAASRNGLQAEALPCEGTHAILGCREWIAGVSGAPVALR
jgi:hypothetical protein